MTTFWKMKYFCFTCDSVCAARPPCCSEKETPLASRNLHFLRKRCVGGGAMIVCADRRKLRLITCKCFLGDDQLLTADQSAQGRAGERILYCYRVNIGEKERMKLRTNEFTRRILSNFSLLEQTRSPNLNERNFRNFIQRTELHSAKERLS